METGTVLMEKGKTMDDEGKKAVIKLVLIVIVIIMCFVSCVKSEQQQRSIEQKKIEWDLKIEQNRRKYGK